MTLGPASREPAVVEQLLAAGANGVRINMSHGTHEEKTEDIRLARETARKTGRPIAVLVDLSGPNTTTGELKHDKPVPLAQGQQSINRTSPHLGEQHQLSTHFHGAPR